MPNNGVNSEIEISTVNENGEVTGTQTVNAVITKPYMYNLFRNIITQSNHIAVAIRSGALDTVTGSNMPLYDLGSWTYWSSMPVHGIGIFCMDEPIENLTSDKYEAPYLQKNQIYMNENVSFYNVNNDLVETDRVMIASNRKCYFDEDDTGITFTVEYIKDSGTGTVASIAIGKLPNPTYMYYSNVFEIFRDPKIPYRDWIASTIAIAFEYSADGTTVYRPSSLTDTLVRSFNFATKEYTEINSAHMKSKIAAGFISMKIGSKLYKSYLVSATTSTVTLSLSIADLTNDTVAVGIPIEIAMDGVTPLADCTPVTVYNYDTQKIEIFVAVALVANQYVTKKVTMDPVDPTAYVVSDVGNLSFRVFTCTYAEMQGTIATQTDQFSFGLYSDGKYYLPIASLVENNTVHEMRNMSANNWYKHGVVTEDFIDFEVIPFYLGSLGGLSKVKAANGEIRNILVNNTDIMCNYMYSSSIITAANLDTPIIKGEDDFLRIRYKFKLVNMASE